MKLLIVILVFSVSFSLIPASTNTKAIRPQNADSKIAVIISGKSRTYYPLEFSHPTVVSVKGPGTLKIITRERIQSQNPQDYIIYYSVNGAQKIQVNFNNIKIDSKASFSDTKLDFPGEAGIFSIELTRGENSVEFLCSNENPIIYARYLFTGTKDKKVNWVSMSPLYPNEPVSLITNEEVLTYYRFTEKKPLKIKITGPTTLKILNRIENHYQMKGRINYRIQIKEDDAVKNTYQLSSIRSDVTVYKKGSSKTPGKANEIIISVPGGTHIYEVSALDKDKNSVLARILFPKKDVKLKE
jgi:hypothetical protein